MRRTSHREDESLRTSLEGAPWTFEVVRHRIGREEVVVCGRLTVNGTSVTAFGGTAVTRDRSGQPVSLAADLNRATRGAMSKAAELLGAPHAAPTSSAATPPPARPVSAEGVMPAISDRLTARQFNAVLATARRRDIDGARLDGMIQERFRKPDLSQLTRREASSLIAELSEANGTHR